MPTYYPIDEAAARRAKEMNSFSDYNPGSATESYRRSVAEAQKAQVDPMYHEKIDRLLDVYARKLAENINQSHAIAARCPSILIAGPANFPVRKKEKQNQAADANMAEWNRIHGLLDKIRGIGTGGISSDDENALQKLREKLARHEREQEMMKAVNAFYRKHGTLDGCPLLSAEDSEPERHLRCQKRNGKMDDARRAGGKHNGTSVGRGAVFGRTGSFFISPAIHVSPAKGR